MGLVRFDVHCELSHVPFIVSIRYQNEKTSTCVYKQAETEFQNAVKKLQAQYQALVSEKDNTLSELKKEYNVALVKDIIRTKQSTNNEL